MNTVSRESKRRRTNTEGVYFFKFPINGGQRQTMVSPYSMFYLVSLNLLRLVIDRGSVNVWLVKIAT